MSEMETDIHNKEMAMAQRYVKSPRHTIQVDYQFYMDELAELTGNKPEFGMNPFVLCMNHFVI